ncbi:FtsK/SpoIIIE domain-containing protein [Streptomyces sp. NBC_00838]|uniref:FtsK/SpoIIIE domain-containing protein n=1 Tax=Streptomyces sp. NBC_00838 TaxID=2903680 RepID=UPI0038694211|nr:FtsK/SpoIIIE domain-containing protein [Streptomyces sp. NBC_00838]
MDWKQAWSKTADTTNTTLDALSPALAPFAARWDAEAGRRAKLRTPENLKKLMDAQKAHNSARSTAATAKSQRMAARKASSNPLSAGRRAARTADKAARGLRRSTQAALKTARKSYPATLRRRAVEAHAVHAVPGAVSSWLMSTAENWTVWPASVSAGLIALNATALWLGRRSVTVSVDDALSAEEQRLVERLDPSFWAQHAESRGLAGTLTTPVEVTPSGLVSHVRLDNRWTPAKFRAMGDEIRALLGARTDLRIEIKPGSHGDRATITLRTRSAADGIDLDGWKPGDPWGVDTVTGEPVMVPLGRRMLIAGTSGSGKSWSTRAILAEASEAPDHRLVVIDPKRVEAINWEHRARIAIYAEDVLDVTDELVEEMHERLHLIPRGQDVIEISEERPRITVFIDEGAEVITMARKKQERATREEPAGPEWSRIMENLGTLARMARAAEIILIWATQKPTMDAKGGIDPQISAQITYRASLALSTSSEARVVLGEDATEKGWHAHELPMPGVAMLRSGPKAKPHPIRTRAFSPKDVIALPDRPVWSRTGVPAAPTGGPLRLVKDVPAASVSSPAGPVSNRDRVLHAVRDGARTGRDICDRTGINKGTVSKVVKAAVESGDVVKAADGSLHIAAGEVAA